MSASHANIPSQRMNVLPLLTLAHGRCRRHLEPLLKLPPLRHGSCFGNNAAPSHTVGQNFPRGEDLAPGIWMTFSTRYRECSSHCSARLLRSGHVYSSAEPRGCCHLVLRQSLSFIDRSPGNRLSKQTAYSAYLLMPWTSDMNVSTNAPRHLPYFSVASATHG